MRNQYFRQAIQTKYIGPTNHRGSRIKAAAQAGSVTMSYRHEFNIDQNHYLAAKMLADKYGWKGELLGGGLKDSCVFVLNSEIEQLQGVANEVLAWAKSSVPHGGNHGGNPHLMKMVELAEKAVQS